MKSKNEIQLRMGAGYRDRLETFQLPLGWDTTVCAQAGGATLGPCDIRKVFSQPIGSGSIRDEARGAKTATILVDDFRRPTPAETLSLEIIRELLEAGIEKENISIVLGNGAHRVMNTKECRRRLGKAYDQVGQVISHDAFSAEVCFVGATKAGTPVLINRVAAEADFSITVSTVYPHTLTCWGGGAKMVVPGVAHVSTSYYHHTRLGRGPWAGNPVDSPARLDIEEAAELFGLNMSACAVVGADKQLCGLRVGNPTKAHRSAVKLARKVYDTNMGALSPDLVIANAYPMDGDPTQVGKTEIPARAYGAPILMVIDFADPCPWHGVYHGPRRPFLRQSHPSFPERTPELLAQAKVFVYCPQAGNGFVPNDLSWYCDDDWDRLMSAMTTRFPTASVVVLPCAPLQIPHRED